MTARRHGRARRAAPGLVALALLAGCPRVPPPDLSRDPAELAGQVRAAQERVRSVRGSARVSIASRELSGRVNELVAAERPDRVRLETVDFFGNPASLLVASGGRFGFLDGRAGVYYRGDATPENVSRLLPVVIPVEELVTILCGSAPLLPGRPAAAAPEQDTVVLTILAGDTAQRIAVREAGTVAWSRLRRLASAPGGPPREVAAGYDLEFHVFDRVGGVPFASQVRLDAPVAGARVDLTWSDDVEVNATLDRALFDVAPPRGVRVVDLARGEAIPRVELPLQQ